MRSAVLHLPVGHISQTGSTTTSRKEVLHRNRIQLAGKALDEAYRLVKIEDGIIFFDNVNKSFLRRISGPTKHWHPVGDIDITLLKKGIVFKVEGLIGGHTPYIVVCQN